MHLRDKYLVMAEQAVVSGGAFATNLLAARLLGPGGYGLFSGVVLVQLFLQSLLQAGIIGMAQVVWARQEVARQRSYTKGLFWSQIAILVTLLFFGVLLYRPASALLPLASSAVMPAMASVLLYLMQDYLRKWFLTLGKAAKALWLSSITNALQLLVLGILWWYNAASLDAVLWTVGLTFLPSVALGIYWLRPGLPAIADMRFATSSYGKESAWMAGSALLQWTAGNFYVLAAGWWLGPAALGALRLAQYIFGLLNVLLQALENYALPRASALHDQPAALLHFLNRLLRITLLAFVPLLAVLALFSGSIMRLAGGDAYQAYGYLLAGLAIIYVLNVLAYPLRIALRVMLLNQVYFYGYLITTAFSLATAWLFIGHWQLQGVLAGLCCTQLLLLVFWWRVFNAKKNVLWKLSISY